MERQSPQSVLRQMRTLYTLGTLGGMTDAQLLEVYLTRHGNDAEDAFAVLVDRHGPTVLGVCHRILARSHDAEDAFQATFLVLARKAASIGRGVRLASWLHGVAVRTASEARRRSTRQSAKERRLMKVSQVESASTEEFSDLLPLLDEELNRLPPRYRSALIACELEGKTRREAAQQLGLPEGTLSTHLARGRKLLRDRLQRRGVSLEFGPLAALSRFVGRAAVSERLLDATVQTAFLWGGGAGTVPPAIASLAERVLRMMLLTRLSLFVAALSAVAASLVSAIVLGSLTPPPAPTNAVGAQPGPNDLSGRAVDKAGAGVPDAQSWAIGGSWDEPETAVVGATDGQGRFLLPGARDHRIAKNAPGRLGLFARARDGRAGWVDSILPNSADGKRIEVELEPAGEARGRLVDQAGHPIAGAVVATFQISRGGRRTTDYFNLSPEPAKFYQTKTAADGSFVLEGIPRGAGVQAKTVIPRFGSPGIWWDSAQSVTIALDNRLGRIQGRLELPDTGELAHQLELGLHNAPPPESSVPRNFEVRCFRNTMAARDGTFQFDDLPPGRYVVNAYFNQDGIIAINPRTEIDVSPDSIAKLEIPLQRLPLITGRVVDAQTGKGLAGIKLESLLTEAEQRSNLFVGEATTDADGRYTIPARPGKTLIEVTGVLKTHLHPSYGEYPRLDVKTSQPWPDLRLTPATGLDGTVVDESGHAVKGAEVFLLASDVAGARRGEPILTGADGTFHFDRLDPDDKLSLWARAGDATTDGAIVVKPNDVKGKLTLSIDSKYAVSIRGMATNRSGQRLAGAKVTLRWNRPHASEKSEMKRMSVGGVLAAHTTTENGWFVFRSLWPGLTYSVVVEARGHNKAEAPNVSGKAGETHDVGKIVLINTGGYLAGKVVGYDGRAIAGAAVFNRGDCPDPIATSSNAEGRFRLEGLFPGAKYVFVRKEGYRFAGTKAENDTDAMTITLFQATEPPRPWKPGSTASFDEQRAFVKQILVRLWEKYGTNANNNSAFWCVDAMAAIDPELALEWSAQHGHHYDDRVHQAQASELAETDSASAIALLSEKHDASAQSVLQGLADRFAESDPKKALLFAAEAAIQARALNQPERTAAMAHAGGVLVKLGRADFGRTLINEAVRDAVQLPTANHAGYTRAEVASILAPYDLKRALALIESIQDEGTERTKRFRAQIAVSIAKTDTKQAVALADTIGGNAFHHEFARSEIAYKIGANQPDEAIKIIEDMKRDPATIWQAEAFGWLAVALAPRDKMRAFAMIDRALALMIDQRDRYSRSAWSGGEMAGAAHIADCAR
jgi:RNA polymerase sigma factor (sigma-70 family)